MNSFMILTCRKLRIDSVRETDTLSEENFTSSETLRSIGGYLIVLDSEDSVDTTEITRANFADTVTSIEMRHQSPLSPLKDSKKRRVTQEEQFCGDDRAEKRKGAACEWQRALLISVEASMGPSLFLGRNRSGKFKLI